MATSHRRIALFGATGGTGSATVRSFIKRQGFRDSVELRLMVRSTAKLSRMIPELTTYKNIHVCQGQITDKATVGECLRDADTIVCALGENSNIAGVKVLQDLSKTITDVLDDMKRASTKEWKKPRLILLSSSTWNTRFTAQAPAPLLWLIKSAFYHPYLDLRMATAHLQASSDLVSLLLVQPGALVYDEPSGAVISTEKASVACTYADLGEGFVELTMEDSYHDLNATGVSSKGGDNFVRYGPGMLLSIARGLSEGYLPGYWMVKNVIKK
ncbi:afli avfa cytochrome p450 monooxygenase [Fusarium globosum]|uniref:Afli avfa cytochrome p450 monooxygenase n=1 Tax=Fusarium globosum TaxID=78864 RepID=A0A8H5YE31_9HYPO|nr:afli avfa cytochrome p450 monooxygenase [Fusarium globosum]